MYLFNPSFVIFEDSILTCRLPTAGVEARRVETIQSSLLFSLLSLQRHYDVRPTGITDVEEGTTATEGPYNGVSSGLSAGSLLYLYLTAIVLI